MFGDIFLPRLNEKLVVLGIAVIIRQKVAESSPFAGGDAGGLGSTSSLIRDLPPGNTVYWVS